MALNFQIKLEDQVSPSAQKAASSLHQLDAAIKNESASLRTLQAEMLGMKKAGHASSEAFKMLSGAIADQRMKVAALKDKMLDAGGLPQAGKAAGLLESIMGSLTSKLGGAGRALGALGPYGIAAAAALAAVGVAATATAGAVAYLATELVRMGVQSSEAKGDVTRSLELLYGGQKAAEHTYKVLEAITGDIAISQGRVMELADTLIQAGQVNGDAMVKSIAAIGKAEAARKGAGAVLEGVITRATSARIFSISRAELMKVGISYKELSKEIAKGIGSTAQDAELRLRTGGVSVKAGLDALSKVVDTKMGDLAMKKFATVGAQTQRLRDLFGRLFEGVDSGPFGRVLMAIANTLEESSVTGSALRTVLKSAFDELSAAAERVAPYVQTFFEGAILLALRFYNALYPVRQAIAKLFGGADEGGLKKTEDTILNLANNVGAGFDLAAKAIAFMIENAGKLAKVIEVLVTLTPGIGAAFTAAKAAILAITSDMTAKQDRSQKSGQAVAEGVAAGIQQKTPAVEAAMAAMGEKGMKAFDAKMQIHSPSKAMQLRGRYLNEGLARGVNDNADAPAKAMAQSGAGAGAAATAGAKAAGGQSGGGPVINVHFASGAIQGMGGAAELQDSLTHTLGDVFYRFAVMQGTG
jgi:hypothetical protein